MKSVDISATGSTVIYPMKNAEILSKAIAERAAQLLRDGFILVSDFEIAKQTISFAALEVLSQKRCEDCGRYFLPLPCCD